MNPEDTDHIDAERYRKLRQLAVKDTALEAMVALEQLDFISSDTYFDETVDKFFRADL